MKQITFFIAFIFSVFHLSAQDCGNGVNDPCIDYGGAFNAHNFAEAWALECGSDQDADAVAVIDIFSNQVHQDLFGKVVNDEVVPIEPLPPYLVCHHGVSVAGTIGAKANNGMHVAGIGCKTKVGLYNVGTGTCNHVGSVGAGVHQAVADGFKIINVSASGTGISLADAINYTNNGVVIVVAAGGNNHSLIADVPGVINCGTVRWNANLGWTYRSAVPINVPDAGVDIFGYPSINRLTGFDGCDPASGGTSIIAPMVSGVVALMRSANPSLTPAEIECIIRMTGRSQVVDGPTDPLPMDANPFLLDAEAAVQMAINYDPESFVGQNVHLSGTQTISNIAVSGSLIIETGADIILDGVAHMGYNSNIIVNRGARLHVKGATVEPMDCISSWRGFRVVGNSFRSQPDENAALNPDDSGVLIIDNGAQINNARKAVSMNNSHIVWDATSNYFGGLVIAEGADFNLNHRSFEFMRYDQFQDNSRITDCTFNNNTKHVITMWRNEGLLIENNEFTNYQKVAIYSENAEYLVQNDNVFNGINNSANLHFGVQINNTTMPDRIPSIVNNTFKSNGYGIVMEGVGHSSDFPIGSPIFGNSFQDVTFGIQIQGTNNYHIGNNSILADDTGIVCFNTESSSNWIHQNRMADGVRGLAVVRNNDGLQFYENCFEDLGVTSQGETFGGGVELFTDDNILPTVHMVQSNIFNNAADNCFENVEDDIYEAISTNLPDDHFAYLVDPSFPNTDCRVPAVKSFIDVEDASSDGATPCVNPPTGPSSYPPVYSSNCTIPTSEVGLENEIAQIEMEIYALLPIDSTDMMERKEIYDLLACLKRLKMELIRNFVSNDKEDQVEVKFGTEDDPYVRTYAYSHLLNTAHYPEALSYLNGVQDSGNEWQDFKQAQLINVNRLQNFDSFEISQQEIDFLYNAGNKHTFYATWIRSIYTAVTDEAIIFNLPSDSSAPKADVNQDYESNISIFPNPTEGHIQVSGLSVDLLYSIKICDVTGKVMKESEKVSGDQKLDISNMVNGVYLLQVYDLENNMIHTSKIIKMNN